MDTRPDATPLPLQTSSSACRRRRLAQKRSVRQRGPRAGLSFLGAQAERGIRFRRSVRAKTLKVAPLPAQFLRGSRTSAPPLERRPRERHLLGVRRHSRQARRRSRFRSCLGRYARPDVVNRAVRLAGKAERALRVADEPDRHQGDVDEGRQAIPKIRRYAPPGKPSPPGINWSPTNASAPWRTIARRPAGASVGTRRSNQSARRAAPVTSASTKSSLDISFVPLDRKMEDAGPPQEPRPVLR